METRRSHRVPGFGAPNYQMSLHSPLGIAVPAVAFASIASGTQHSGDPGTSCGASASYGGVFPPLPLLYLDLYPTRSAVVELLRRSLSCGFCTVCRFVLAYYGLRNTHAFVRNIAPHALGCLLEAVSVHYQRVEPIRDRDRRVASGPHR